MTTRAIPPQRLPGPPAWPLPGNRAHLLKLLRDPCTYSRWLHDNYGDIVALAKGNHTSILAFGPEHNFQLLSQPALFEMGKGRILKGTGDTTLGHLLSSNLLNMNGEQHKRHRQLLQPAFHARQIGRYHNDMVTLTTLMLERWQSLPRIELYTQMQQLTRRIAVKTLFGLSDEQTIDQIGMLFQQLLAAQAWLMFTPLIDVPGLPYHRALKRASQLAGVLSAMIAQKRGAAERSDVLASLVLAHDADGTALTEIELVSHTLSLYAAGHVTTSTALTWTLFLLHQHPRILTSLLAELDDTLRGAAPACGALEHCPLLDGVIKESLRLLPPTPTSMRIAASACEVGGFALPTGAIIFFSPFGTHRLPTLYEEPDRFKPERWATLSRTPYEYLPFAAGSHRCLGAEFAILEIKVVLAMVLQQYRLAVMPQTRIEPKGSGMNPAYGMPVRLLPQDRRFERVPVRGGIHRLVDWGDAEPG